VFVSKTILLWADFICGHSNEQNVCRVSRYTTKTACDSSSNDKLDCGRPFP
jgi:hypothetical protein